MRIRNESGQALPIGVGIVLVALLAMATVDLARQYVEERTAYNAAQAGALAADGVVLNGGSWSQAQAVADRIIGQNGIATQDASVQQVGLAVKVRIGMDMDTSFLALAGIHTLAVTAVAKAQGGYISPDPYSLLTLANSQGSIFVLGSNTLDVSGNLFSDGGISIANLGGGIRTTGTLGMAGTAIAPLGGLSAGQGGVQQNQPPVADPLAPYLQNAQPQPPILPPGPSGGNCPSGGLLSILPCDSQSATTVTFPTGSYPAGILISGSSDQVTLDPGNYSGGITVLGSNDTITLEPGLYYFGNGTFAVDGVGDSLAGSGVMLFGTSGFSLNGIGLKVQLSAPSTPVYPNAPEGIVLWDAGSSVLQWGGDSIQLQGSVYAPQSQMVMLGTISSGVVSGQVIVYDLAVTLISNMDIGNTPTAKVVAPKLVTPS